MAATDNGRDAQDGFAEVFGSAIDKAVRQAVDTVGRSPLADLEPGHPGDDRELEGAAGEGDARQHDADEAPPPMPPLGTVDPYELLGVDRRAEWDEIQAAYKRRARVWHPDGAEPQQRERREELIRDLNAAYAELRVRRGR